MVHRIFQLPAEEFLIGIALEGSPSFFWSLEDLLSFLWYPYAVPQVEGIEEVATHSTSYRRRHKCNGVLPGALRRSLMTLAKFHPSGKQPSAQCLTPWLRQTIVRFANFSNVTPLCNEDARVGFWRG
jgi:hypothetical protein